MQCFHPFLQCAQQDELHADSTDGSSAQSILEAIERRLQNLEESMEVSNKRGKVDVVLGSQWFARAAFFVC